MTVDGLAIHPAGVGSRFGLSVKPGGRKDRVIGVHGDRLKLEVRAAPEAGRANDGVIALLAEVLGLRRDQIEITAGRSGRSKSVKVELSPATVRERLALLG